MSIELFRLDTQQNNPIGVLQRAENWSTSVLAAVALHPNEAPVVADLRSRFKNY